MTRAILLTGTIDTAAFQNTNVRLTDTAERLRQYGNAIRFYIQETKLRKIIFVENSGYPFDFQKFEAMAKANGKAFEYIPIKTDLQQTLLKGKSYGRADCIEQGVTKSRLLADEASFYKTTGRVIIRNIDKLLDRDDLSKFVFGINDPWCYTVFFKMNIAEYRQFFINAKDMCDEAVGIDIESAYYRICKTSNVQLGQFKRYPQYDGIVGTSGTECYNDTKYALILKTVYLKAGLFSLEKRKNLLEQIIRARAKILKKEL